MTHHHRPNRTLRIVARDGVATAGELQADYEAALAGRNAEHLPTSVVDTVDYLLKHEAPEYFSAWLARRSTAEQAQIAKYIAEKK